MSMVRAQCISRRDNSSGEAACPTTIGSHLLDVVYEPLSDTRGRETRSTISAISLVSKHAMDLTRLGEDNVNRLNVGQMQQGNVQWSIKLSL
jgi:hypothetical protein